MTPSRNDRPGNPAPQQKENRQRTSAKTKAAIAGRELSADELEAVAAAGDGSKGDPNSKKPLPPAAP